MITLAIPNVSFLLGYGGMATVKHTIKYARGYWVAHDSKGRLVALASQCSRLIKKLDPLELHNSIAPTETTNQ
jgi:hypothetical protein